MPDSVNTLERQALDAMQRGSHQEALTYWSRVLTLAPRHAVALTQMGQAAFKSGDFQGAREAFQRAAGADGSDPRQWVNVAVACQQLGDGEAEEAALFKALSIDPSDLMALVLRGSMYERQGRTHLAASAYGAAAAVSPPLDRLIPELRPAVTHAMSYRDQHMQKFAAFVDEFMQPHLQLADRRSLERFRLSLDILVGRKQRYDPQPMRYFVPQLPVVEFFDRNRFPWLDDLESATPRIRAEFEEVLREENADVSPYIQYSADQPVAQWAELNHSPRWSAFHLVKDGQPVPGNSQRCPETMAVWSRTPWPDQPGRTPVAMFSLLKPRTRIPAHVGASNARLVTHLPLIVPAGCRFRVGNQTRVWEPGKAWVFDDTIEHEAWNDSDQLRVVLIFDTWHPDLNPEERRMITELNRALNAFNAESAVEYDV